MDPSYPNFVCNLNDSQEFQSFQTYQNSQFFSNPEQFPFTEYIQTSPNTRNNSKGGGDKSDVVEDIDLMSAYCIASGNPIIGKNRKRLSLWSHVKELYDANRAENPEKLGDRNVGQMKGRWKRLNENAGKWISAYREAYRLKRSGMSMKDVENEAHKIYEAGGSKFNDSVVFNEVMCNHPKWKLDLEPNTTRSRPEEGESGGSTKRSRTTEEGEYSVPSNPETPSSGGSVSNRPIGRDAAKRKGKGKASNEVVEELRALRLTRDNEVEVMKKRLELDQQREQKLEEMELMKMQLVHLNTLLQKESLSPDEENMKRFLMSKFYGN